jgi:hypothetical protein
MRRFSVTAHLSMKWLALVVLFTVACLGCGHDASSATHRSQTLHFVIAPRAVAGVSVTPSTSFIRFRQAFSTLGVTGDAQFVIGGCRLTYAGIGLFASFDDLLTSGKGTANGCSSLGTIVANAPNWRTSNGLRIGMSLAELRSRYPHAYRGSVVSGNQRGVPSGSRIWELNSVSGHTATPILIAFVNRDKVAALGIEVVGH